LFALKNWDRRWLWRRRRCVGMVKGTFRGLECRAGRRRSPRRAFRRPLSLDVAHFIFPAAIGTGELEKFLACDLRASKGLRTICDPGCMSSRSRALRRGGRGAARRFDVLEVSFAAVAREDGAQDPAGPAPRPGEAPRGDGPAGSARGPRAAHGERARACGPRPGPPSVDRLRSVVAHASGRARTTPLNAAARRAQTARLGAPPKTQEISGSRGSSTAGPRRSGRGSRTSTARS